MHGSETQVPAYTRIPVSNALPHSEAVTLAPVPVNLYHTPPPTPFAVPQNGALSAVKRVVFPETTSPQATGVAVRHTSPWALAGSGASIATAAMDRCSRCLIAFGLG